MAANETHRPQIFAPKIDLSVLQDPFERILC